MNTHSSRLTQTFADLQQADKKALIPFITTGDPQGTDIVELMHALVKGGADIIELGMPFSDPAADGPIIQQAGERAIANGISYHDSFAALKTFRQSNDKTPVVLMGYLNSAETCDAGFDGFAEAAHAAGADALILVDLSYESGADYRQILRTRQLDLISLVAPTTNKTRLGKMLKSAGGFVYYVSMRGTTGNGAQLNHEEIRQAVSNIREKTDLPVCIGFGIADGQTAKKMAEFADGVVVGSALVKKLYNAAQNKENVLTVAGDFMQSLRQALDS